MEGLNLVSTFAEFKEGKNIDRPTMMSVLEEAFRAQLEKMYGEGSKFAEGFGGGGHVRASGFTVRNTGLDELTGEVVKRVQDIL